MESFKTFFRNFIGWLKNRISGIYPSPPLIQDSFYDSVNFLRIQTSKKFLFLNKIFKYLHIFSKNMLYFHVGFFCALNRVWVLNSRRTLGLKNLEQIFSEKLSYFCLFQTLTYLLRAEFPTKTFAQFGLEQISKYLGSKKNCSSSIKKSIHKWIENRKVWK